MGTMATGPPPPPRPCTTAEDAEGPLEEDANVADIFHSNQINDTSMLQAAHLAKLITAQHTQKYCTHDTRKA